ncbi:hypothetical protein D046_0857B, partial [Vibrio parahaemolyticus V-223/04]
WAVWHVMLADLPLDDIGRIFFGNRPA